jgi:hypothetical protein
MKFGQEIQRVASTRALAQDAQLKDALLPYKTLKKQIKTNGCMEPHVDNFAAPVLPIPGEASEQGGTEADNGAAPSGEKVGQLLETSPFLRFLEAELRSVTKTIEQEAQKIDDQLHEADKTPTDATQNQELANRARALHMVFTTNQTALRKILKKFDVRCHPS